MSKPSLSAATLSDSQKYLLDYVNKIIAENQISRENLKYVTDSLGRKIFLRQEEAHDKSPTRKLDLENDPSSIIHSLAGHAQQYMLMPDKTSVNLNANIREMLGRAKEILKYEKPKRSANEIFNLQKVLYRLLHSFKLDDRSPTAKAEYDGRLMMALDLIKYLFNPNNEILVNKDGWLIKDNLWHDDVCGFNVLTSIFINYDRLANMAHDLSGLANFDPNFFNNVTAKSNPKNPEAHLNFATNIVLNQDLLGSNPLSLAISYNNVIAVQNIFSKLNSFSGPQKLEFLKVILTQMTDYKGKSFLIAVLTRENQQTETRECKEALVEFFHELQNFEPKDFSLLQEFISKKSDEFYKEGKSVDGLTFLLKSEDAIIIKEIINTVISWAPSRQHAFAYAFKLFSNVDAEKNSQFLRLAIKNNSSSLITIIENLRSLSDGEEQFAEHFQKLLLQENVTAFYPLSAIVQEKNPVTKNFETKSLDYVISVINSIKNDKTRTDLIRSLLTFKSANHQNTLNQAFISGNIGAIKKMFTLITSVKDARLQYEILRDALILGNHSSCLFTASNNNSFEMTQEIFNAIAKITDPELRQRLAIEILEMPDKPEKPRTAMGHAYNCSYAHEGKIRSALPLEQQSLPAYFEGIIKIFGLKNLDPIIHRIQRINGDDHNRLLNIKDEHIAVARKRNSGLFEITAQPATWKTAPAPAVNAWIKAEPAQTLPQIPQEEKKDEDFPALPLAEGPKQLLAKQQVEKDKAFNAQFPTLSSLKPNKPSGSVKPGMSSQTKTPPTQGAWGKK